MLLRGGDAAPGYGALSGLTNLTRGASRCRHASAAETEGDSGSMTDAEAPADDDGQRGSGPSSALSCSGRWWSVVGSRVESSGVCVASGSRRRHASAAETGRGGIIDEEAPADDDGRRGSGPSFALSCRGRWWSVLGARVKSSGVCIATGSRAYGGHIVVRCAGVTNDDVSVRCSLPGEGPVVSPLVSHGAAMLFASGRKVS